MESFEVSYRRFFSSAIFSQAPRFLPIVGNFSQSFHRLSFSQGLPKLPSCESHFHFFSGHFPILLFISFFFGESLFWSPLFLGRKRGGWEDLTRVWDPQSNISKREKDRERINEKALPALFLRTADFFFGFSVGEENNAPPLPEPRHTLISRKPIS